MRFYLKRASFAFCLLLLLVSGCYAQDKVNEAYSYQPKTGSWGDQGDGTFKNPILNSNYPDSDVEKWGDKWYMISSKGRYMKGMTILESEDLVNWTIIGGIVDSVDWYTDGKGEGVWAGDLVRQNGKWLCYFIDIDKGLFVCSAADIKGPWSKPALIMEKKGMTDPSVYFDQKEKKGYLICNYEIMGTGDQRKYHNRLFELSWDGLKVLNTGRDIYVEFGAEAAKIYKVNNYFYIFFSEWTLNDKKQKDDRRQIVLRSKHVGGPFEKKVLLERDPVTGRSCSQGALVQAPDKSWWYFHQLIQKENTFEGRPQHLIPVAWKNNWPVLGQDPDGNGIGNTIWQGKKPVQGKAVKAPGTDDDFGQTMLGHQWLWDGNPQNDLWSLSESPGNLRLYGAVPENEKNPYRTLPNKLLQRKMGKGNDTIVTKMNYRNIGNAGEAGLIVTGFNLAAIGIKKDSLSQPGIYVQDCMGNREYKGISQQNHWVFLRAILKDRYLQFSYSMDGKYYITLGKGCLMETRGFNGLFLGLYHKTDNAGNAGYVDFDWFSYKYDGPKEKHLVNMD